MLYDFQINIFSLEIQLGQQSTYTKYVCLHTRWFCFSELPDTSVCMKEEGFCTLAGAWLALASFLEKNLLFKLFWTHVISQCK